MLRWVPALPALLVASAALSALSALSAVSAVSATSPASLTSSPITAKDIDSRSWTLLAPGAHQLDLLLFVATDCPISNRYAAEIGRICSDYRRRGVRCFIVYPDAAGPDNDINNVNDVNNVAAVAKHHAEYGFSAAGPAIIDRRHALVAAVGPRVTPEAAVYSSAGRVYRGRIDDMYIDVGRSSRQATRHDVRLALDAALAGRPVAQPETEAIGCFITNP